MMRSLLTPPSQFMNDYWNGWMWGIDQPHWLGKHDMNAVHVVIPNHAHAHTHALRDKLAGKHAPPHTHTDTHRHTHTHIFTTPHGHECEWIVKHSFFFNGHGLYQCYVLHSEGELGSWSVLKREEWRESLCHEYAALLTSGALRDPILQQGRGPYYTQTQLQRGGLYVYNIWIHLFIVVLNKDVLFLTRTVCFKIKVTECLSPSVIPCEVSSQVFMHIVQK